MQNPSQKPARASIHWPLLVSFALLAPALVRATAFAAVDPTPPAKPAPNCQTTREFVTALEFLRADEDFKLKDKETEARETAFKIAEGCTGAAKRFIRAAKAVTRAGANRRDATETGLKFAPATDAETDTFVTVFRRAIAEDSLDLEFDESVRIAFSLSREFAGDQKRVAQDFETIVDYCADSTKLGLPRMQCGSFAARIARTGEKWNGGAAKPFIKTFEYLTSESGPSLTTGDALRTAELLAQQGPGSHENFQQAYQYATSGSGLNLPRNEAILFARRMANTAKSDTAKSGPAKSDAAKTEAQKTAPAKAPGR